MLVKATLFHQLRRNTEIEECFATQLWLSFLFFAACVFTKPEKIMFLKGIADGGQVTDEDCIMKES